MLVLLIILSKTGSHDNLKKESINSNFSTELKPAHFKYPAFCQIFRYSNSKSPKKITLPTTLRRTQNEINLYYSKDGELIIFSLINL